MYMYYSTSSECIAQVLVAVSVWVDGVVLLEYHVQLDENC
jgi:hypothetical protein